MKFLKQFKFLLFLAIILAASFSLSAQATIDSIPINPCTAPELGCPLDSNLIVLVVAAGIIAAKKAYSFKNYASKV